MSVSKKHCGKITIGTLSSGVEPDGKASGGETFGYGTRLDKSYQETNNYRFGEKNVCSSGGVLGSALGLKVNIVCIICWKLWQTASIDQCHSTQH